MLSNTCVQLATRAPQVLVGRVIQRGLATPAVAAKSAPKPPGKFPPGVPPKAPSPPSLSKLDVKAKKDFEPFSDDFTNDPTPITLTPPPPPITRPPQPFAANKKPAAPASKVLAATTPSPASILNSVSTPTLVTPATPATNPASAIPPPPAAPAKQPAKKGNPAQKGKAPARPSLSLANIPTAPALPSAAAQAKALKGELGGRTPAQLLNQITQLQQHNATLQSQLVYHSAVDAIYGESGFNQLRNLLSEFTEEETNVLKAAGFESENVIHHLETRQRDLCLQFTQSMGTEIAKHIGAYVKKLKDQHRQSASAATATQQTLRNAGVPDTVISSTLVGLQPHLDEIQTRMVRWEKLKADVDLLLATHAPSSKSS